MRYTADVRGVSPPVSDQNLSESAFYPLVAFYNIHRRTDKKERKKQY
jgi:hypothetical protein